MKILTFKRLIGLAAIGGVAYAHKQRGGEWTLSSVGDTLKHLWTTAGRKLEPVKREMRDTLDRAARGAEPGARGQRLDDRGQRLDDRGQRLDDRTSVTFRDDKRKGDVGPH